MRPAALIDRMASAILHPLEFVLALVELVIAYRGDCEPHHRERLDGRLVVEPGGQKWTGTDQAPGGDEDRVLVALADFLDERCHMLGAARRHRDLFGLVVGIGDPDPAR